MKKETEKTDLTRYLILTRIEASERQRICAEKKAYWKKVGIYYGIVTAVIWTVTALSYLGIWFTDSNPEVGVILGIFASLYWWVMRGTDLSDWRPPTAEEMNEIGDEII